MKKINGLAIKRFIRNFISSKIFIPIVSAILLLVFPAFFLLNYAFSQSVIGLSFMIDLRLDIYLILGWGVMLFVILLWTKMYKISFVIYILLNLIFISEMVYEVAQAEVIKTIIVLRIIPMSLLWGYYDLHLGFRHSKHK